MATEPSGNAREASPASGESGTAPASVRARETLAEAIERHLRSTDWQTDPEAIAKGVAGFLMDSWMDHGWINGFAIIRPSDDLLRDIGRGVVERLRSGDQEIDTLGVRGRACFMWWNAS